MKFPIYLAPLLLLAAQPVMAQEADTSEGLALNLGEGELSGGVGAMQDGMDGGGGLVVQIIPSQTNAGTINSQGVPQRSPAASANPSANQAVSARTGS